MKLERLFLQPGTNGHLGLNRIALHDSCHSLIDYTFFVSGLRGHHVTDEDNVGLMSIM